MKKKLKDARVQFRESVNQCLEHLVGQVAKMKRTKQHTQGENPAVVFSAIVEDEGRPGKHCPFLK